MPESPEESNRDGDSPANNSQVEAATEQPNEQAPQPAQQSQWEMVKSFAIRMLIFYFIMNFMRSGKTPTTTTSSDGNGEMTPTQTYAPARNMYSEGYSFDMKLYLSESDTMPRAVEHIYTERGIKYMEWSGGDDDEATYTFAHSFNASQNLLKNGSLYLHVWMLPEHEDPLTQGADGLMHIHKVKQLNKFKKRRFVNTVNLLTGRTDIHPDLVKKDNSTDVEVLSHWHPNITINYVNDQTNWVKGTIPKPLDEYIEFTRDSLYYYPPLYFNDYWNLQSDYMPINDTTPWLNLTITIHPLSMLKWQFYSAQGLRNQWYSNFLGDDSTEQTDEEQDVLKRTMLDTNPYLLGVTIVVSIVHSVFEFLAFKNDIQFWRERKSLEGLSVRSVFFGVFQSLIVLLYILDNETNFVVKISVGIGLLIDIWKINKVVDIWLDFENKWLGVIPRLTFTDKSTYVQSKTRKYDQMAFKYLSWVLYPLLIGYGVYSLIYHEHKGWYSWVLNMLYGFLLMFGFIMMTPQLFINYKLKSVAHLPWRMMTYKALNTFVDDLFAFVIKMPTLYRIGCFRDDIVFLIFLYQRWIYKVDPSRVNEFGTSGESDKPVDETPPIENQDSNSISEKTDSKTPADKKNQ